MKRRLFLSLLACGASLTAVFAMPTAEYALDVPRPPTMLVTTNLSEQSEWYRTNNVMFGAAGVVKSTNDQHLVSSDDPNVVGEVEHYRLDYAIAGYSWELLKPQYHLGDVIVPPTNVDHKVAKRVDWAKTYAAFLESADANAFLFNVDSTSPCVFAAASGTHAFTWIFTDGERQEVAYTSASVGSGRPRRIYLTDYPYNGPKVSLQGKFVKFFGDEALVNPKPVTVTNTVNGMRIEQKDKIVSGLYLDESSMTLEARGDQTGQCLMAYYADANYEKILCVQTIEVRRPDTIARTGIIGEPLTPDGRGYDVEGLSPIVRAGIGDVIDGRGDYLYIHQGMHDYSPHNGDIFPVRPTLGESWKAELCWMEEDAMKVRWPFEIDQYECTWPTDMPCFLRGDKAGDLGKAMTIPSTMTATLMTYQEPEGHAKDVTVDGRFETDLASYGVTEGVSLLKIVADDNLWFVPVRSVTRSNKSYYTLEPVPLPLGQEIVLSRASREMLGPLASFKATSKEPGYVYAPGTPAGNYDSALYAATNDAASAVYAVSEKGNIEVWWSAHYQPDGLPDALTIPTVPMVVKPVVPETEEAPQIVLASQKGSANETRFGHYGAATFDSANACLTLPDRVYFPDGSGTFAFWTRPTAVDGPLAVVTNATSSLLHFGAGTNGLFGVVIGADERLEVRSGHKCVASVKLTQKKANEWTHVAVTINKGPYATSGCLYVNGVQKGTWLETIPSFASGPQVTACIGVSSSIGRRLAVGNQSAESVETSASSEKALVTASAAAKVSSCTNWAGMAEALRGGKDVKLVADIGQAGDEQIVLSNPCDVTLDLNGHRIHGSTNEAHRVFTITGENVHLTICDTVGGGSIRGRDENHKAVRHQVDGAFLQLAGSAQSSSVTLKGGGISLFETTASGGAFDLNAGTLRLEGGRIFDCVSTNGGAIRATGTASVVMTGGEIFNCTATNGAAILAQGRSTVSVTGGGISKCRVVPIAKTENARVVMTGGVFDFIPSSDIGANLSDPIKIGGVNLYLMPTAPGRQIAEVLMFSKVLTSDEVRKEMESTYEGTEVGVTGYFSFRPGEDLESVSQTKDGQRRTFLDRAGDPVERYEARDVYLATPGVPLKTACVLSSDTEPKIYRQNDRSKPGYNPNEEHAFVKQGSGAYVVWALRCDLGETGAHQAVLTEYVKDGRNALQYCHVVATNDDWPVLGTNCYAGALLPGPHPITDFDDPWMDENYWETVRGRDAVYRDRKGQLWCRAGGRVFDIYMYYRNQETFDWPTLTTPPASGTVVPWLSALGKGKATKITALSGAPHPWRWKTLWPTNGIPEMKIGQTLTVAEKNLPEVWGAKSVAVLYPGPDDPDADMVVRLSDPTREQFAYLSEDAFKLTGLTTDPDGGLVLRKGRYYFTEASPFLSTRLYYDVERELLCLIGDRPEKRAATPVLYPNTLTAAERRSVYELVKPVRRSEAWSAAVANLATAPVYPNTAKFRVNRREGFRELVTTYGAVDHYALTAVGGTNYVVLIENDASDKTMAKGDVCPVDDGDAINMHVFKVVAEYYEGGVVTREDENNLLSQQLSILYTDPIGGFADDFEFEWREHAPNADGTVPDPSVSWTKRDPVTKNGEDANGVGLTRFVTGQQGDTLANMVNKYWACRYRAAEGTVARAVMGDQWSKWCGPALAEGWIQRVLNNVTPFTQRMTDLYENKAETAVSMIQQAGAPYAGDVALNQDNLTSVGLIQLYETLLNKAESLSVLQGSNDDGANQQLLLAVERLADLYKVLGDEAYSDAKNPTIGFGQTVGGQTAVEFGNESSSLFCFDNQVNSLLDEELCLLRGRSGVSAPSTQRGPWYNRLVWNFTKGITAGEVAYAVNYDAGGTETVALSEEQAARLYPQGHGDAYGHYLSALKGWYRLLRNPNFSWGTPKQGEMNVADAPVNVDYYDEAKFAEAAADLAKTAADVVDLTARKAWRDTAAGDTAAGYLDANVTNAFGYGQWASRGAYGALCNWVVANSLLPMDSTLEVEELKSWSPEYVDAGLTRIDRGTVDELGDICERADEIVRALDRIDGGLNPLGLSDTAIPFDIAPQGVADGSSTHYEQVRDRAKVALGNARKVLARAQTQASRLRMIEEAAEDYAEQIDESEEDYEEQLIGYYGTPYTGDIGVGKTYVQGYEGPDLVHYVWMDLSKFGIRAVKKSTKAVNVTSALSKMTSTQLLATFNLFTRETELTFDLTSSGFIAKPSSIDGERLRQGSIQEKYGEFLLQYLKMKSAEDALNVKLDKYALEVDHYKTVFGLNAKIKLVEKVLPTVRDLVEQIDAECEAALDRLYAADEETEASCEMVEDLVVEEVGAGTTVITSPRSVAEAVEAPVEMTSTLLTQAAEKIIKGVQSTADASLTSLENSLADLQSELESVKSDWEYSSKLRETYLDINAASATLKNEWAALNTCIEAYKVEVAKAEAVLDRREAARKRQVSDLSKLRYNEMLFRKIRDKALTRYSAAFDLAQKLVYQTAQVYDYETALKRTAEGSGDAFKAKIVTTRSLGAFASDGEPIVADDGDLGLAGYLAQMDANWQVLKPRLGINNPQQYTTWFSLRHELFRIYDGEEGDANWAQELGKYWVDDIQSHPVYLRHCQKFQSQYGLKDREPGLVIPFTTTIDFAKNLFGNDLVDENDHAYDSTWYSTRIASAGVWFDGYNEKTATAASTARPILAATPTVYLIPTGADCLRAPGLGDGSFWRFSVTDQVIPAPYAIGSYELDDDTWYPSLDAADWSEGDPTVKIRRHPMFRAYFGAEGAQPDDARLDATRLVGRSVWNDRWYLIIPAGAMNADREQALKAFISGLDTNGDGNLDVKPVRDIKIGFRTYSQSGN